MFTRREKQNLLYLGIGIVIGVAITALVAYFSVISSFTKENIVKIYNILPSTDSTKITAEQPIYYKKEQVEKEYNRVLTDTPVAVSGKVEKDTLPTPTSSPIIIKTDIKIAEAVIPIAYFVLDTSTDTKSAVSKKGELLVEQWDNPTNFAGYRKMQNKLVIYGIDIDDIALESVDDNLYLVFNNKKLLLKDSDNFLRYPYEFLK